MSVLPTAETHGHRHQRQQFRINRHAKDETLANVVKKQLNIVSSPVLSSDSPNFMSEERLDEEGDLYENVIEDHIDIDTKWRNPQRPSTSASIIPSSSQVDITNQRISNGDDVEEETNSSDNEEERSNRICQTSTSPAPIQHCIKKQNEPYRPKVCAKGDAICIPANYSKFDLPNELERTEVRNMLIFSY